MDANIARTSGVRKSGQEQFIKWLTSEFCGKEYNFLEGSP